MMWKSIFGFLAFLFAVFMLTWVLQGGDWFMYKFWAPKYEQVRRETFEQTKSFRQGMIQEIRKSQREYASADTQSKKDAIASYILHSTADFPEEEMPSDIRGFMSDIRSSKKF
jgi:hypothetical protein